MWVIDPIDGTIGFVKKTGDFAVMIALLENGRPTLGVVYSPSNDTLYYAEKGMGAFMEKDGTTTRLAVSTRDTQELRVLRSVNHFTPTMQAVTSILQANPVPQGSVGLKAGKLAEAEGDFFFSEGALGEWDVCAPEIIASEAGGLVTDFDYQPLFYGT
jgi:3'(2'), 5'-bisphosphate nucleotidase